ncbi:MAG: molybdopterin adenylyltransferase [Campylobacter sp.]|nr:molybdopterin adenylyltransferase [Campylobacter sp.]
MKAKIGILSISDRASKGLYEDKSGPAIRLCLDEWLSSEREYHYEVIPDEFELIKEKLIYFCDELACDLVLTTGGTGPAPRDLTPEATEAVCEKILPGFGELMRSESLKFVPTAILSRQIAGIRKKSLILNLPGNPKAIGECLEPVFPAIPYCIDLIGGAYIQCDETKMKAFRPKNK